MTVNVSSWSIRNPTPAILLFGVLTLAGLSAFRAMRVQNFPDLEPPTVTVTALLPGASPSQLETDVARKIESSLVTVRGVKHVQSTLTDGVARFSIEFQFETPLQEAVDDVRDALARTRSELPPEVREPVVEKVQFASGPILTYTISSDRMDDEALSWFVDDEVSRALLAVPGVGAVTRVGGVEREVRIALDPDRLLALNAGAPEIARQLRQALHDGSSGRTAFGGAEWPVRTVATVQTAADLARLEVTLDDGRNVRLEHVAAVSDTVAEQRSVALLDGRPVIGFEVTRARGAGEIEVAEGVRAALAVLTARHPTVTMREAVDLVTPVIENYAGSMWLLYEGAALAVLVVFLFLRDWRATLVSAVALPLSVIPTYAVMHLMGFTFNTVTLLALSLVTGILVDDAIVEVENIERHLRMGKTPYRAAMEAADEIGLAVIATTFTLIAVFLPTAFMRGTIGKFFVQFGWTTAVAVFFSLVVARMLTPMMAAHLLRAPRTTVEPERNWVRVYLSWVRACLRRRAATAAVAAGVCVVGFLVAATRPGAFMPPDDDATAQVTLTLPPGSKLYDTLAVAERARVILRRNPHVQQVYTAVGGGNGGAGPSEPGASSAANVRTAVLTIAVSHRSARPGLRKQAIEEQLRQALTVLPGVRVNVGGSGESYVLVLAGDDGRALAEHAQRVERELRSIPGIGAVTSSASLVQPELVVRPDFARAADLGVSATAVADALRVATLGDYEQELAKLDLSARQVPVVVRLADAARDDLETLERLSVPGARGRVPLRNFATLAMGSGPAEIRRYDRLRNVNVEVELSGRQLGDVERAALALPSLRRLPPGVRLTTVGDAEAMSELVSSFGSAVLTGVLCIYVVLVLLLKSFAQPFTILTALVLAVPGAALALLVTGGTLSMPSSIGLIMLMGTVTKNSILLVDYAIIARQEHGLARWDALVDACRKRVRPIVMTTVAMGAGMLPVALGLGADPSFRAPMASVVIGGLLTSTLLSLLVIPVAYTYVDDLAQWVRARVGGTSQPAPREQARLSVAERGAAAE